LWFRHTSRRSSRVEAKTKTILWARTGGYTTVGEADNDSVLREIFDIETFVAEALKQEQGELLNAFNATFCVAFDSAPAAYRVARKIVDRQGIVPMACALHSSQLYYRAGRVLSSGIGTAQRISAFAHSRTIVLSDAVVGSLRSHIGERFGLRKIGVVPGPSGQEIFAVVEAEELTRERRRAFISYRRENGAEMARLISSELKNRGIGTFLDVDDLGAAHFDAQLYQQIETMKNFVLLLSPRSLERCKEEGDWLCKEIAHALKTKRRIVPVMTEKFVMPSAKELPDAIAELPRHQAVEYSHQYADRALAKVVEFLQVEGA
jgi:class 3 adenylate cyclase